jgi:transcriptional regulator with XRE-family HTH domain
MAVFLGMVETFSMPRKTPHIEPPAQRRSRHFVRAWRKYRGLTQEQLADRIGVSGSNISLLESGKQNYTQRILEELALALGTSPASLLAEDPADQTGAWQIMEKLRLLSPAERRRAIAILDALARTASAGK